MPFNRTYACKTLLSILRLRRGVGLGFLLLLFSSCTGLFMDRDKSNTARNNFDLLWKIIDERYCYFEEKDVDWDAIYQKYLHELIQYECGTYPQSECLFNTMTNMLEELRDGHVCLSDGFMTRTYKGWHHSYPENFDFARANAYKNSDRNTVYLNNETTVSVLPESVGYLRCPSFSDKFNRYDLDEAIARFE